MAPTTTQQEEKTMEALAQETTVWINGCEEKVLPHLPLIEAKKSAPLVIPVPTCGDSLCLEYGACSCGAE